MSTRDRNGLLSGAFVAPLLVVVLVAAGVYLLAAGYIPGNASAWGPQMKPGAAALGAGLLVAAGLLYRYWERRL